MVQFQTTAYTLKQLKILNLINQVAKTNNNAPFYYDVVYQIPLTQTWTDGLLPTNSSYSSLANAQDPRLRSIGQLSSLYPVLRVNSTSVKDVFSLFGPQKFALTAPNLNITSTETLEKKTERAKSSDTAPQSYRVL